MYNLNQSLVGVNANLIKAGLAIGTTQGSTGTIKTTTTTSYTIDSIYYSKSNTDNIAIVPAIAAQVNAIQAVLTTCLYLVQIDSAGAVTVVKGKEVLTSDLTNGSKVLEWPQPTDNRAVIGAYRVSLASTATYQFGVTALNASNVTTTYYDLVSIPSAPLTS